MNTQNDGWIKMSERMPQEEHFPVWWCHDGNVALAREALDWIPSVYWQCANIPAPPAKEKTQREMDEEAFRSWLWRAMPFDAVDAWHAALAYRDKQNAEDLAGYATTHESILRAKRRCGLDQ